MSFIVSNTYDIHATASLDLQFANKKSLVDQISGRNLVDHTRASSGTYVGSDGLIKTAVTNLLLQSEDFSTTWTTEDVNLTVNDIIAPDGKLTADKFEQSGVLSASALQSVTKSASPITYTGSVFIKATTSSFTFTIDDGSTVDRGRCVFNLSNGTLTSTNNDGDFTGTSGSIIAYPDGWYRLVLTTTSNSENTARLRFFGNNVFYAWGAQLEQSDTVGEYVKTTSTINSAPRFDHDPTTGESLGLLMEESRTNLLLQSENLSGYLKRFATTPFDSSVVNPTGLTGSYRILANSGTSTNGIRINGSASSANTISVSAFVKKSTYRYVYIGFGGTGSSFVALFDIEPGLTSNRLLGQGGSGTYTNVAAGYQDFPDDWVRIWAIGTATGGDGINLGLSPDATTFNISNWTAAGTEEIYAWGLQYEDNASFPTSYIPTEGSTVTRAADVASISGSNFSSWYRQDEGTFFADIVGFPITLGQFPRIFEASDGTSNNIIRSQQYGANTVRNNILTGGSVAMAQDGGQIDAGTSGKTAFGVAENNCSIVTNGGTPSVDNTVTMPSNLNQLEILGTTGGTAIANSTISRFTYWPQRLPNETLQTITQ